MLKETQIIQVFGMTSPTLVTSLTNWMNKAMSCFGIKKKSQVLICVRGRGRKCPSDTRVVLNQFFLDELLHVLVHHEELDPGPALGQCGWCDQIGTQKIGGLQKLLC